MAEHTKVKWIACASVPSDGFDCYWIYDAASNLVEIASVNGPQRSPAVQERARLIAAAPDLLVALELALLHIEIDETTHGRSFAAGNVARAAIHLAKHGAASTNEEAV